MLSRLSSTLPFAIPVASMFAVGPDTARACGPEPCDPSTIFEDLQPVNAAAIPIDGVLVLQATTELPNESVISRLEVTVMRAGLPVAGSVETTAGDGVLVWRPSEALVPGPHAAHLKYVHGDDSSYCGIPGDFEEDFTFEVQDVPAQPLAPPTVEPVQTVTITEDERIDNIVCCDEAFPYEDYGCGPSEDIFWSRGECAAFSGTGFLKITLTVDPMQGPALSGLLLRTVLVDGAPVKSGAIDQFVLRDDRPFCTQVELRNLATGETSVSAQQCHGDDVATQLGPQMLDPERTLADKCEGPLYTCTVLEGVPRRWDKDDCTPIEGQEGTDTASSDTASSDAASSDTGGEGGQNEPVGRGCACDSGPGEPMTAIGLLGVAMLRRRRRRAARG